MNWRSMVSGLSNVRKRMADRNLPSRGDILHEGSRAGSSLAIHRCSPTLADGPSWFCRRSAKAIQENVQ